MKEIIEKEISKFAARHERCIATDAEYTDKQMVEILSNSMKQNYAEDLRELRKAFRRVYKAGQRAK